MANNIQDQLREKYVGEMIELYDIDLSPIGVNSKIYLTNTSATSVSWQGRTYQPFPLSSNGVSRNLTQAPGRISLRVSNVNNFLTAAVLTYGDLVGADVTRWRTFSNFLDGAPNADPDQHFPIERYTIIQKAAFNESLIEFVCATKLDRPGLMLPRRQILRDQVDGALWCPGVARSGVR